MHAHITILLRLSTPCRSLPSLSHISLLFCTLLYCRVHLSLSTTPCRRDAQQDFAEVKTSNSNSERLQLQRYPHPSLLILSFRKHFFLFCSSMDTPKRKGVRTNTPRVLTKAKAELNSSQSPALQKAPRVQFTTVRSAPASVANRKPFGQRTPSVSRARTAPSYAFSGAERGRPQVNQRTATRDANGGADSRSSSCSRPAPRSTGQGPALELTPPPPLYRPPTTPAEENRFAERLDYEEQLLVEYQKEELRKRGLNEEAVPPPRPPSRCGSVDSRMSSSQKRRPCAPACAGETRRRHLAPARKPSRGPSAQKNRPDGAEADACGAHAPTSKQPGKPPAARSTQRAADVRASPQSALLRPTSVRLGGPTATQAAAKRSAALRTAPKPANTTATQDGPQSRSRTSTSPPQTAARSRPVIHGGSTQAARSTSDAARNSTSLSQDEHGAGRVTSPYDVHLESKQSSSLALHVSREVPRGASRGRASTTQTACTKDTAVHTAPRTVVKKPPVTTSSVVRTKAIRQAPRTALRPSSPAQDDATAHASSEAAAAPGKRTYKKLTVRHAQVPNRPQRTNGSVPPFDKSKSIDSAQATPVEHHWPSSRAIDDTDSHSLNSVGCSESADDTNGEASPYQPEVYVPRLRLPTITENS